MTQQQDHPKTDYLAVAKDAHARGFCTTPVKPMAKHPRLNKYNTCPATNLSIATQNSYDYPHDDVGLVSRKGIKNFCWLDIDWHGVEGMIFRDTGHRLPRTLTTSSRPITAPWKKHLCFRQTAFSVSLWRTEMSGIRDYDIVEDGEIPNLFDVKGVGGGGFVVSAGCCRVTEFPKGSGTFINEQYTYTDDWGVIDIPDWLVRWVLDWWKRFNKARAIRAAAEADARRREQSARMKADTELRVAIFEYDPTKGVLSIDAKGGALVPKEYRNGFLKSLGGEVATRGIPRDQTERMLQIAAELCESYTEDDDRDKAIQKVVNRLRVGNLWIGRAQLRDAEGEFTGDSDASLLASSLVNPPTRLSTLRHAAKSLPWGLGDLPSHLVNERLRAAMRTAGLNCGTEVDWKKAVSTALRGIGAKSRKSRSSSGRLVWVWYWKSPDKSKQDGNVVNFTGENKDLAPSEPEMPPSQESTKYTKGELCN